MFAERIESFFIFNFICAEWIRGQDPEKTFGTLTASSGKAGFANVFSVLKASSELSFHMRVLALQSHLPSEIRKALLPGCPSSDKGEPADQQSCLEASVKEQ